MFFFFILKMIVLNCIEDGWMLDALGKKLVVMEQI